MYALNSKDVTRAKSHVLKLAARHTDYALDFSILNDVDDVDADACTAEARERADSATHALANSTVAAPSSIWDRWHTGLYVEGNYFL